jgi:hypothetical protein
MVDSNTDIIERHRHIEKLISKKGIQFIKQDYPIEVSVELHNYSKVLGSDFEEKIDAHLFNLNQAFTVDSILFRQISGEPIPNKSNNYSIFSLTVLRQTERQILEWSGINERTYGSDKKKIHIATYDDLPNQYGIGYSHFPWISTTQRGAITMNSKAFISNEESNLNSALIHLIANHLGLYPLTGEYKCGDDYVHDTPIHNSPITICPDLVITSTCDNQKYDISNYMSFAPYGCKDHFTLGQWRRMLHIMNYSDQLN